MIEELQIRKVFALKKCSMLLWQSRYKTNR